MFRSFGAFVVGRCQHGTCCRPKKGTRKKPVAISVKWDRSGIAGLETGKLKGALKRALKKAGASAIRDMRSEATKRIRARKRIPIKYIRRALSIIRQNSGDISSMKWGVAFSGEKVPLVAYGPRQTKKGVSVSVNVGKRTLVKGAFIATMKSGHKGVFVRRGKGRLPIRELAGSRPVDALLHAGEADGVSVRGGQSFQATFARVLPLEIGK